MTMTNDWDKYWRIGSTDDNMHNMIFWAKDETDAEDHMPNGKDFYRKGQSLGSGSLAIMNSKTFRWLENTETWEEM